MFFSSGIFLTTTTYYKTYYYYENSFKMKNHQFQTQNSMLLTANATICAIKLFHVLWDDILGRYFGMILQYFGMKIYYDFLLRRKKPELNQ